ncbi:hypothetical protein ACE7GA_23465 [Roseomonas sp. CCTCC AB2023176]|uniref:hypothetical protein n=1 Tax=Roseomonas sp. CCTCC AB2023176 TaxID=3342640 RepID=UPI0035DFD4C7
MSARPSRNCGNSPPSTAPSSANAWRDQRTTTLTIPTPVQVVAGLRSAWLLAQGKVAGLPLVMLSPEGALRSFWAMAFGAPVFVALRLTDPDALTPTRFAAEVIGYVLSWTIFPLLSHRFAEASGRAPLWPGFIAAWNWANLAQYAALVVAILLAAVLPPSLGTAARLAAFGYTLWLEWFIARHALRLDNGRAVALVALDFVIGLVITMLVTAIGRG